MYTHIVPDRIVEVFSIRCCFDRGHLWNAGRFLARHGRVVHGERKQHSVNDWRRSSIITPIRIDCSWGWIEFIAGRDPLAHCYLNVAALTPPSCRTHRNEIETYSRCKVANPRLITVHVSKWSGGHHRTIIFQVPSLIHRTTERIIHSAFL